MNNIYFNIILIEFYSVFLLNCADFNRRAGINGKNGRLYRVATERLLQTFTNTCFLNFVLFYLEI